MPGRYLTILEFNSDTRVVIALYRLVNKLVGQLYSDACV